jgi:hypothetical protein
MKHLRLQLRLLRDERAAHGLKPGLAHAAAHAFRNRPAALTRLPRLIRLLLAPLLLLLLLGMLRVA